MIASKAETARFWDQLLQFIEEGRVVPIVGQDLLVCEIDGQTTLLYPYLAAQLADYLGVPADPPSPRFADSLWLIGTGTSTRFNASRSSRKSRA